MNTNLETRKIDPTVNHNTAIKHNLLRQCEETISVDLSVTVEYYGNV